jgi:membrane protease YdiL (CAAX protease family)
MNESHVLLDHILLVTITLIWPLAEWIWFYPRFAKAIEAGVSGARARLYCSILIPEWVFTGSVAALWIWRGRSWRTLMLGSSTPVRLGIGFALVAPVFVLLWMQRRALSGRPDRLGLVRRKLGPFEPLIPRTQGEYRIAMFVAITAGICEEFLFRGFAIWYFRTFFPSVWIGTIVAVLMSSLLFGLGHLYLGARQVRVSGSAGMAAALIMVAGGSLLPTILLHTALDMDAMDLGYRAMAGENSDPAVPVVSCPMPPVSCLRQFGGARWVVVLGRGWLED